MSRKRNAALGERGGGESSTGRSLTCPHYTPLDPRLQGVIRTADLHRMIDFSLDKIDEHQTLASYYYNQFLEQQRRARAHQDILTELQRLIPTGQASGGRG